MWTRLSLMATMSTSPDIHSWTSNIPFVALWNLQLTLESRKNHCTSKYEAEIPPTNGFMWNCNVMKTVGVMPTDKNINSIQLRVCVYLDFEINYIWDLYLCQAAPQSICVLDTWFDAWHYIQNEYGMINMQDKLSYNKLMCGRERVRRSVQSVSFLFRWCFLYRIHYFILVSVRW